MVHSAYVLPNTIITHDTHNKIYKELKISKDVYFKILDGTCIDKKYENIKIYEDDNNLIGYDIKFRQRFIGIAKYILQNYKDELEEAKNLKAEYEIDGKAMSLKEICDKLCLSKSKVMKMIKNCDGIKSSSKKRIKELEDAVAYRQKMYDDLRKEYDDYVLYRKEIEERLIGRIF